MALLPVSPSRRGRSSGGNNKQDTAVAAAAQQNSPEEDSPLLFKPYRIDYKDLVDDTIFGTTFKPSFLRAVTDVGLVSITGIPFVTSSSGTTSSNDGDDAAANNKEETLSLLHDCALVSAATQELAFADGTRRLTMATHSIPGAGGMHKMQHGTGIDDKCTRFSEAANNFREVIADVTDIFALRLSSILQHDGSDNEGSMTSNDNEPLLTTQDGSYSFSTFHDVVKYGEHLEHFHSYQHVSETPEYNAAATKSPRTIDIHTDQGLFIAFTPGRFIDIHNPTVSNTAGGGFFIELQDGSQAMVAFDQHDDLVFMLGDGIHQIIKHKDGAYNKRTQLRATPHALIMPKHDLKYARVWYGRMVLPPRDAIHPDHKNKTFGDIRLGLIAASATVASNIVNSYDLDNINAASSLGCSSAMSVRNLHSQNQNCENDTMYCWFQCMNYTEFGVSHDICAEQDLDLACVNPRHQLYTGGHGDYYPACIDIDTAGNATAYPPLRDEPWDEELCTSDKLDIFKGESDYDHALTMGNATLLWSITDDSSAINGRFVFNGLFGWLAFGFANVGGNKNGMHGATVIMAHPGANYSAKEGLDLSLGPNINEYVVDPQQSSFRFWQTPVSESVVLDTNVTATERASYSGNTTSNKIYAVDTNDCFTAITFKASGIHDKVFTINGTGMDELIWAANAEDYFVGYHGPVNRGRFAVNWLNGEAAVNGVPVDNKKNERSAASKSMTSVGTRMMLGGATIFVLALSLYYV